MDLIGRLEQEVDRCGIRAVLESLAIVCDLKAEHLASNWQDTKTAKVWAHWARTIDRASALKQLDPLEPYEPKSKQIAV
jgi:hypothetical protein